MPFCGSCGWCQGDNEYKHKVEERVREIKGKAEVLAFLNQKKEARVQELLELEAKQRSEGVANNCSKVPKASAEDLIFNKFNVIFNHIGIKADGQKEKGVGVKRQYSTISHRHWVVDTAEFQKVKKMPGNK